MPVPRRFDRRMPERDQTRINERIRVPEVRLIDDQGEQAGVMKIDDALKYAQERDLDLVEVAPEAKPPVCRVLDYSKYKYEQAQKVKAAKKGQQQITIREIKFRPKIAEHDYATKRGHVMRFLMHKDKVKVTIMFRGREVTHPEQGRMILERLGLELAPIGQIDQRPNLDGRNMTMILAPTKEVLSGEITEFEPEDLSHEEVQDRLHPGSRRAQAQPAEEPDAEPAQETAAEPAEEAAEPAGDAAPAEPAEEAADAEAPAAG